MNICIRPIHPECPNCGNTKHTKRNSSDQIIWDNCGYDEANDGD
jgi:predicted RNA-binding Zn-ribbon protein involved in translation (DUF1610 family)